MTEAEADEVVMVIEGRPWWEPPMVKLLLEVGIFITVLLGNAVAVLSIVVDLFGSDKFKGSGSACVCCGGTLIITCGGLFG